MAALITRRYQQALARLRNQTSAVVGEAWGMLGSYNESDIPDFLDQVVPIVGAAQSQAVALTDAYLAHLLQRPPIGLAVAALIGAAVRNGTTPDEVYTRSFVTVWTALKNGDWWDAAVAAGQARAESAASMDVILSTRAAASDVVQQDTGIVGWQRVPDDTACEFCLLISQQRYSTYDLMPAHNYCGCTVEPIMASERGNFTPSNTANDITVTRYTPAVQAEIVYHGELGPLVVNAADHYDGEPDIHYGWRAQQLAELDNPDN